MRFVKMNWISNKIWGWIASYVCDNFFIWDYIKTLEEYNVMETVSPVPDLNSYIAPCLDKIYAVKDKTGTIYDIYYKNLHFHIVDNGTNDVFQIFIKQEDDTWNILKKGNNYDVSSPETTCVEIYYWFDIETMHGFKCSHSAYRKGTWNEYVAKNIEEFEKMVEDLTVESKIGNAYKNFKTE